MNTTPDDDLPDDFEPEELEVEEFDDVRDLLGYEPDLD